MKLRVVSNEYIINGRINNEKNHRILNFRINFLKRLFNLAAIDTHLYVSTFFLLNFYFYLNTIYYLLLISHQLSLIKNK